jgi:hypothetical protein
MRIDRTTFKTFVPEGFSLHFLEAHNMTVRIYCLPMTARGLCTETCENCKARLVKAMQLQEAYKPVALFTWMLRNAIAEAQEANQLLEHITPDMHPLGFKREVSPFEALLRETD